MPRLVTVLLLLISLTIRIIFSIYYSSEVINQNQTFRQSQLQYQLLQQQVSSLHTQLVQLQSLSHLTQIVDYSSLSPITNQIDLNRF